MYRSLLALHHCWFGDDEFKLPPKPRRQRWFMSSDAFDAELRDQFAALLESLSAQPPMHLSRREQVALVLLFDQVPRNIFRASASAFAYDALARLHAGRLLHSAQAKGLSPLEHGFALMPFEHSEDLRDQRYCLAGMQALARANTGRGELSDFLGGFVDFAEQHLQIIQRFGRFPHRNAVLGRENTSAEQQYLDDQAPRFGQ